MEASDVLKISVSLVVTVAFITLSLLCLRTSSGMMKSTTSDISSLGTKNSHSLANALNNQVTDGTKVLALIDTYYKKVPILIITSELYNNSPKKFSYDVTGVYSKLAPEYINRSFKYLVNVGFDINKDVIWIRIVQEDITNEHNVATVEDTLDEFTNLDAVYNKRDELIQQQYKLFQKENEAQSE